MSHGFIDPRPFYVTQTLVRQQEKEKDQNLSNLSESNIVRE